MTRLKKKIDERGDHSASWQNKARNVCPAMRWLVDIKQLESSDETVEKKEHGETPTKNINLSAEIPTMKIGDLCKNHGEGEYRKKGPNSCACDADGGLLVSNGFIAPIKDFKKLSVVPKIHRLVCGGTPRFKDDFYVCVVNVDLL
jgi:hypothetical protein